MSAHTVTGLQIVRMTCRDCDAPMRPLLPHWPDQVMAYTCAAECWNVPVVQVELPDLESSCPGGCGSYDLVGSGNWCGH